jgi:hypothetical protein
MSKYQLEMFADYFQIWLEDRETFKYQEFQPKFTDQHLSDRVWVYPQMIIMFTVRNFTVPVTLEIVDAKPGDVDLMDWDHIVEASIEVISSSFTISGLNDVAELTYHGYPNTTYRVRMCHANLDSLSEDGLDGDDHYKIVVWPEAYKDVVVLKRWVEPA